MQSQIMIFSQHAALASTLNVVFGLPYTIHWCKEPYRVIDVRAANTLAALLLDTSDEAAPYVVRQMRAATSVPILAIIASDNSDTRVGALRAGADDVISRPFADEVLVARLQAKLRRVVFEQHKRWIVPSAGVQRTILERRQMHLSPIEQRLLTLLRERAGSVVPFTELQHELWAEQVKLGRLRYHIHQLRYRLASHGSDMRIEIARGDGYRLVH